MPMMVDRPVRTGLPVRDFGVFVFVHGNMATSCMRSNDEMAMFETTFAVLKV